MTMLTSTFLASGRRTLVAALFVMGTGCYGVPLIANHDGASDGPTADATGTGGASAGAGGSSTGARGGTGGAAGTGGTGGVGGAGGAAGTGGTGGGGGTNVCVAPATQCTNVCANLATDINNCTACGKICLPPPANGSAICQGAAGCGIQCDSGHLKCGNTCCDTPPANAFATCSGSATCGVQCNSGSHACNATSSPCYDDIDVTHCGASCVDCRQPNATAVCNGTQCANICNGATLACPGVGGHVACGTWNFESGTVEGWANSSADWGMDATAGTLQASRVQARNGSYALAVGHSNPAGDGSHFSAIKIHLCPTGTPVDLTSKSLLVDLYVAPTVGGSLDPGFSAELFVQMYSGQNPAGQQPLDNGMPLAAGQWLVSRTATLSGSITDIEIIFRTFNGPWVGTIYFDNVKIQ